MRNVADLLDLTSRLDARFYLLQDGMERDKERTVVSLARVLAAAGTPYAVIGGLAVQFRSRDPRTTLDVDLAVQSYASLPRQALQSAGFRLLGQHAHSENWVGPDHTPVQFTDDPLLGEAIQSAEEHRMGELVLRIATAFELVRAKLRAARDPSRRRSKRLIDLADALGLVEQDPSIRARLSAEEQQQLADAG
jgi:hypothetical protein